ncbi:phosphoglucosamine mutase [Brevibacillus sp. SYP-B805]|uniref:phosphoglucosamine mutase n=1 Tax=Brevibacillus sp. SYP-B805 TaxID=1578199 RepID=UPI0013EDD067|nr:phosphoglucosamine mutase [Brevibacillus sp. SYP-B805]NGQ97512.1 phosphoglucosamine mutase [Brevibacillus sp. SYP-B805]
MGKYFGTDGVRGIANEQLTPELAFKVGRFGGYVLTRHKQDGKPKVVIGRDTRISGQMLESALIAGLLSVGAEVVRLGVISTAGVAYLTRALGADAGVMISASHNPYPDNGIKFFGSNGFKLSDDVEAEIEQLLDAPEDRLPRPTGEKIGTVLDFLEGGQKYLSHLKNTVSERFEGLKVVLDCANGAVSSLAARLFADVEAEVITVGASPNGVNINEQCGSTHPEKLREEVLKHKADLGLSFDGDADRCIAVDETGEIIDGDYIMAICARALKAKGKLNNNTIVTTVMANLGFFKAMEEAGINTTKTAVGDRYVVEEMVRGGYNLGGEQSGHIIFLDHNTTGDGLLTGLQLLNVIKEAGKPLSELRQIMRKYPQILVNVPVADKTKLAGNSAIEQAIKEVEQELAGNGRVLVRPSGTEPIVRVMAEGPDEAQLQALVDRIAEVVKQELA